MQLTHKIPDTMTDLKIPIKKLHITSAPIKIKDGKITHIGVNPRPDAIGWSRLYMHLWKTGIKQLNIPSASVTEKQNNIEKWVIEALNDIKNYDLRTDNTKTYSGINPDKINYDDVKAILKIAGKPDNFETFSADLKDKNEDNWFYSHTKFGEI